MRSIRMFLTLLALSLGVLWGGVEQVQAQSTNQIQPGTWGGIKAMYGSATALAVDPADEGVLPIIDGSGPPLREPPDSIKLKAERILKGLPRVETNQYIAGVPSWLILSNAYSWLGVKYVYGGNSRSGIDCSHLVYQVYQGSGITSYPYLTTAQMKTYSKFICVAWNEEGGDIVLFSKLSHTGIYIGGGWMVDANSTYGKVMYDYIWDSYWSKQGPYAVRYVP